MLKNFFITSWRNLARNKSYTILNVSGLAIGVVVCLLIGIWLQREVSFDDFHPNGNNIYRLSNTFRSESESFSQAPSGPAFGAHLTEQLPLIKASSRVFNQTYKLKYADKQFLESGAVCVDSNFFNFFGFKLKEGNKSKVLSSPGQIVLTEELAKKYFGDDDPVGKVITVDGTHPLTVSGVAENPPVNSQLQFDLLVTTAFLRNELIKNYQFDMDSLWVGGWPYVYVELRDGTGWKQAEQQINAVAARFSEKDWKENKMTYHYFLQPIRNIHLESNLRYDAKNNGSLAQVKIFAIIGIIVLLLACINYVNLTTAGAIKRAKETSVRKVAGANKMQLIRQFFLETFIICTIAVSLGVLMLKIVLPAFETWLGQSYSFNLNVANLLTIFGFIIFMSVIAGIYPAVVLSSFNPVVSLKGNFFQSPRGNLIRKTLVVFQFTITIALVASIFIISQQMNYIRNKSLGFNGKTVININYFNEQNVNNKYDALRNELLKSPYIENTSRHNGNIVGGMGNGWTTAENLKGEEISTSLYQMATDADYLNTYSMQLAAGRFFSKTIPTDTIKSVLVNEAAVKTFGWQKPENAIGKRFGKGDDTRYVIGVIKNFNFESLHKPVEALLLGYSVSGSEMSLKVNASHIDEVVSHIKKTWQALEPDVPLSYSFVDERVAAQYGSEQKMQGIFYGFSALSLLIACLGLFGLTTFVVERKIKEIGIRKVLGASVPDIVGLLSSDFIKLVLMSILIATPISWYFMNNWLRDFAYRININWWIFLIAGVIAVLIALITVSIQSIKAAIANPVKSLRTE
jgi:putative ABC transport system permease protein